MDEIKNRKLSTQKKRRKKRTKQVEKTVPFSIIQVDKRRLNKPNVDMVHIADD